MPSGCDRATPAGRARHPEEPRDRWEVPPAFDLDGDGLTVRIHTPAGLTPSKGTLLVKRAPDGVGAGDDAGGGV